MMSGSWGVKTGDWVEAGAFIGKTSNCGYTAGTTGYHLHFEVGSTANRSTRYDAYRNGWLHQENAPQSGSGTTNVIDTRYPTPFKAFTLERQNIDCYYSINGSRAGAIWPDDECTIQEVYTNGWCKLSCPWPSDANGYKIVYAPTSAFIDTSYMVSEHNILTIAAGYTRKDMANWYANIPEGTHFWRIGKTGPGGYTQIIYYADGVGYRSMWIVHPGDKVKELDIGSDFYAYIINSSQWRHATNEVDANGVSNVTLRTGVPTDSQIWRFEYQGSGYYKIINCETGHVLEVFQAQDCDYANVKTWEWNGGDNELWMICGIWNGTSTLEPKCSTRVLDVCDNSTEEGANVQLYTQNGSEAQLFRMWTDLPRTLIYDANGGSGAPESRTEQYRTTFSLSTVVPKRTGYTFLGWSTDSTATTSTYKAGASFTLNDYTTLYAVWKQGCPDSHSYSYAATKNPTTSATGTLTGTCSKCKGTTTVTLPKLNTTDYTYAVKTAATCTADGTGTYTWKTTTYGNYSFNVTLTKTGHSYSYAATKNPTTSATGTLTGTCSKCKGTTTVTLPKLNTTDYTYAVKTAATCTTDGTGTYTWKTTTYGNFSFNVTLAKIGHSYSYAATKNPTTSSTGTLTGTCSKCKGTTTVTLPKLTTTDYTYAVKTAATCTADGTGTYTWKTTTYGNFSFNVTLAKTGHSYSYAATKNPTTSSTGTLTGTCSKCKGTTTVTLPKLTTTDYTYAVKTAATCTADGTGTYTWKTTTYGNFSFNVTLAKTGHSYSYAATKNPTTSSTGTLTGTCSKCKGTTTVTLPKLTTTDYTYAVKTAATCTADGTGTYIWKTTTYGNFSFNVTLAKTGHSYSYAATKNPTTSATGTLTGTCSKCKGTTTVTLPKLTTTDYTYAVKTAATCTADGIGTYTWKTTTYGNFSFNVTLAKTGHSYSYSATKNPTTSATGTLTGTCSKCKGTTSVTLPKLTTTDYTYAVKTAATCTADGTGTYTWKTTTYGNFSFNVTLTKTGHSYSYAATKNPTTSATGTLTGTCSKCKGTTTVTLPKLTTTDYTYAVKTAATCTADGTGTYTWKTTTYGNFSFNVTLTKTGHSYSYAATKNPTTSATGTLTGTCSKCKGTTTVTLPKLTTTDYTYAVKTAATCTADGTGTYTWKTTTYGNFSFNVTLTKTGHSYSYAVTKDPTTSATGTLTGTCSKCKGTTTVTLPKLATTDYTYAVKTAATCTTDGTATYTWKTTTYGNFSFNVTLTKTGHSYSYAATKNPTTSATGTLTGTCSKCKGTTTVTLPKLTTTDYTYVVKTAATCTADGTGIYTWKTTTYGNFSFNVTLAKTGHSYSYAVTEQPTTLATGTLTGTCSKCGGLTTVILPMLNTTDYAYVEKAAATCTTDGTGTYTWKTTTYGSFSFDVTLAKIGHRYENGSCATCGASDPNYIPGTTKPTLTLKSPTLEFKDMICINAFYTADNTQDVVEMGMITYDEKVTSPSVDTADHVIPGATYNADTGRYVSSSQGIHAKYLSDTIYLAVYAKLKDGSYAYSKLAPYSAVTYATNQLKNSTDVKLKKLVAAMLNYGAEAQLYFGHNTGNLANAALTADQKALPDTYRADMINSVPAASAAKQGIFANNSGFASRKPAISFEGAFCINYFFTPKYAPTSGITLYYWNEADYNAADVLTTANATGKIKLDGSGTGEYRGDITGIAAKNLSGAVYVAAAYKNGSTVWTSGVLGYSIGTYCSSQVSKGGTIAELAKTTAVYGYHAKQYFG